MEFLSDSKLIFVGFSFTQKKVKWHFIKTNNGIVSFCIKLFDNIDLSDCCLTPSEQYRNYIMARTSYTSIR